MTNSYVAIDIETTGLEPRLDKITEIAALRVVDGAVEGRFVTLVNPGRPLGERIVELTGITDGMLAGAPAIGDVIGPLVRFCGDLPLLGHNILFDYSFLKRAAVNQGLDFQREGIDTLNLCRAFMPGEHKKNLSAACAFYCIEQVEAHRAEADALSAHLLYQKLLEGRGEGREELFTPKSLIYKAKKEQPVTKRQKEYLQDLVKCHRIDTVSYTHLPWGGGYRYLLKGDRADRGIVGAAEARPSSLFRHAPARFTRSGTKTREGPRLSGGG